MAEYENREQQFDQSLGNVMGSWMLEIAKADLTRQQGWLSAVEALAKPDKDGNIPTITLHSGITGPDSKPISGADISFPVVLSMLGEQFAGEEADLNMTMNVSASTLDASHGEEKGSAEGEASFGIAGIKATVKVSASFSEAQEHKRESDYRATTTANLKMARVKTPEPIQRVLQAFMKTVDVECQIASAIIENNAKQVAQDKGLLPKGDDSGGGGDDTPPDDGGGDDTPPDNGGDGN